MSHYPPPEFEGPLDVLQGGCALMVLGLTLFGIVALVLTLLGVVR